MAITSEKPITLTEVYNSIEDDERGEKIKLFLKDFVKLSPEEAEEMKTDLNALNLIRLKDTSVVKIIDFMPQTASELNKVLIDTSFEEDEVAKILDVVKKY
ncbi:MAG: DNA-directed RNA polymerase subunit F [Patescibacteria group bacterium]|jgi:DNA-directed RNA polymerase subunit F